MRTAFLTACAMAILACDKDPAKAEPGSAPTASTATPPPAPPPPAAPTKPQLAIDDTAVFIAGERMDGAAPDLKGRVVAALAGKPVEGETVVLNAARDTKMAKVTAVFAALAAKKVKGVEVHTPLRDRSPAEVVFVTKVKASDCSAVGFIAKDSAITAWPVAGATAERFTHGMAGPDLTRGSEGIRKRVLGCDSAVFFVSAEESVTWGLTFDLARAVLFPDDAGSGGAGTGAKSRSPALLLKPPVPGRKVDIE